MLVLFAISFAHALEPDLDGDGWTADVDCDDSDAAVNPDADEACDGIDNDCDALVDDDDSGKLIGYQGLWIDADGDGFGGSLWKRFCVAPRSGWTPQWGDCDDSDPTVAGAFLIHPDNDGDGYGYDGWIGYACKTVPTGYVVTGGDCDDGTATTHPDAPEVCNAADDNCDGLVDLADPLAVGTTFYDDEDQDGYGDDTVTDSTGCDARRDYVVVGGDCDVGDPLTHPNAIELCDGVDNDCDGSVDDSVGDIDWYADADGDGYGDASDVVSDCAQPPGYGYATDDCDDTDRTVSPGRDEVCGNGVDDDCDGAYDECTRDPGAVADFTMVGTEPAGMGAAIRTADANGDGTADLLLGAPGGAAGSGMALVVLGPSAGDWTSDDAIATFTGPSAGSAFGSALDGGDFNGDGYDDLLVGAPASSVNSAWLFYGPLTGNVAADRADVFIEGNVGAYTNTASAVAIVPDHSGDGAPDVVIGMPSAIAWQPGHVIVLSAPLDRKVSMRKGAALSYRGNARDYAGASVADLGDQNGDGYEDILIGAPNESRVYVENGGTVHSGWMAYDADATLQGNYDRYNVFGAAIATADIDGDGYGDAVVSAPWEANVRGDRAGVVTVYYGPFAGEHQERAAPLRYGGTDPTGWFGASVATGGDVDGDGAVDTLIGDPFDGAYPNYTSAVYLQLGTTEGFVDVHHMTAFRQSGATNLGSSVQFVPDWNGDGASEVAVGATAAEGNGKVSVIFSDSLFE